MPIKGADYGYYPDDAQTELSLSLSRRGRALNYVNISRSVRCSNGREDSIDYVWDLDRVRVQGVQPTRVPIQRDGSFSSPFAEPKADLHPFAISEEYWLAGRFIRRGKAVRLYLRIRQVGEGGSVCDTGELRFTARAV